MLKRSLLLIPVLLVLTAVSWQSPAMGQQQSIELRKAIPEKATPTRLRQPNYYGARALGNPGISWTAVASSEPQLKQMQSISGVSAKPYVRFEPSADRVWESVPRPDSGLQLRIGGYL